VRVRVVLLLAWRLCGLRWSCRCRTTHRSTPDVPRGCQCRPRRRSCGLAATIETDGCRTTARRRHGRRWVLTPPSLVSAASLR
jgi:hypothetical protein